MKNVICLLGVLLLVSLTPALADSISPVAVTGTLAIGDSATIHKTVTIDAGTPTSNKVDVFFLADTTGSMGGVIGAVRASASSILSSTAGLGDVAFGVGEYRDIGDYYGQYRLNTAMTSSQATAQAGIDLWVAGGGGDYQESDLFALNSVATQAATGWRTGSARILVWMGDASGHDPSGGVTEAIATASLVANHIKTLGVDVGSMNDTGQVGRITAATGGTMYSGIDSGSIVDTITAAISSAFSTYSTVGLDFSEAGPHVTVTSAPGSYSGAYSRSAAETFEFDVTFTGVSAGTDTFNIYATVDGGRVATEADRITVTGGVVPEPSSILLFGTMILGLGGVLKRRLRG